MAIGGTAQDKVVKCSLPDAIGKGFWFVFYHLTRFFALSWACILIATAAISASNVVAEVAHTAVPAPTKWLEYSGYALYYIAFALFAVRWHRFFLLNVEERFFRNLLSRRNWVFLGYASALAALYLIIIWLFLFWIDVGRHTRMFQMAVDLGVENFKLLLLFVTWALWAVFLRFSLILPATAVDRPISLVEAWTRMRGNTWRFISAFFFGPFLARLVLEHLLRMSFGRNEPAASDPVEVIVAANLVTTFIDFFSAAVGVTVLSLFYRQIVEKRNVPWPEPWSELPKPPWQ